MFYYLLLPFLFILPSPAGAAAGSVHAFHSGMNCLGSWKLPDTGQTASYATGDDGYYNPAASQPSYKINNPTGVSSVTADNVTGLMWMTNPKTDAGLGAAYTWEGALAACEGKDYAGYTDWRLPNMHELMTIINFGVSSNPYINTTYFPSTFAGHYWTSTTDVSSPAYAWVVYFNSPGDIRSDDKTSTNYVRCVRGGP